MGPSWRDIVANRNKREDDYVARKWHRLLISVVDIMRPDLCYVK